MIHDESLVDYIQQHQNQNEYHEAASHRPCRFVDIRSDLVQSVIEGADCTKNLSKFMNIDAPLKEKCPELDELVNIIFKDNCKDLNSHQIIIKALSLLIRYGQNLLKGKSVRPQFWKAVKFSNGAFKDKVDVINGARHILKLFGYTEHLTDGLAFPNGAEPNPLVVAGVSCDLMLVKHELMAYMQRQHPHPHHIDNLVSENGRIYQSFRSFDKHGQHVAPNDNKENVKSTKVPGSFDWLVDHRDENSAYNTKSTPPNKIADVYEPFQDFSASSSIGQNVTTFRQNKRAGKSTPPFVAPKPLLKANPHSTNTTLDFEYCVVCGVETATLHCKECNDSRCNCCDQLWHSHVSRRNHNKEKIYNAIVPDAIMVIPGNLAAPTDDSKTKPGGQPLPNRQVNPQHESHEKKLWKYSADGLCMDTLVNLIRCLVLLCEKIVEFCVHDRQIDELVQNTEFEDNPVYLKQTRMKDDCKRMIFVLIDSYEQIKKEIKKFDLEDGIYVSLHVGKEENIQLAKKKQELERMQKSPIFARELPFMCETFNFSKKEIIFEITKELTGRLEDIQNILAMSPYSEDMTYKINLEKEWRFQEELKSMQMKDHGRKPSKGILAKLFRIKSDPISSDEEFFDANDSFSATRSDRNAYQNEIYKADMAKPTSSMGKPTSVPSAISTSHNYVSNSSRPLLKDVAKQAQNSLSLKITKENNASVRNNNIQPLQETRALEWQCEHCTYHNPVGVTECNICMKKNTKPEMIHENDELSLEHTHLRIGDSSNALVVHQTKNEPLSAASELSTTSSQSVREQLERKRFEEEQLCQAKNLVQALKNAETSLQLGIDEVETLIACVEGVNYQELLLPGVWNHLLEYVNIRATFKAKQQNLGEITRKQVVSSLLETKNVGAAEDKCLRDRQDYIDTLCAQFNHIQRDKIILAIEESCGDEDEVLKILSKDCLQPLDGYIWGEGEDVSKPFIEQDQFIEFIYDKEQNKEKRIRTILAEGNMKSWGRAMSVISIIDDYADDIGQFVSLSDIIDAVTSTISGGVADSMYFLRQTCLICDTIFPANKIGNLNFCDCKICYECIENYFSYHIRESHLQVQRLMCPACEAPGIADADKLKDYFQFLANFLKNILPPDLHKALLDRLANWSVMKEPDFRWCCHCGCGFIYQAIGQRKMTCPSCKKHMCFQCKKQWEPAHDDLTCEQFQEWKLQNDPEALAAGLAKYLEANGIDCPNCKYRYSLAKGGCMHFTCRNGCQYEFCNGCSQPYSRSAACTIGKEKCGKMGIHCHHPRDCLFYLKEYDIATLHTLLKNSNIEFRTGNIDNIDAVDICEVLEQKELTEGVNNVVLRDIACGKEVVDAGLCSVHYKEYLVSLVNKNHIDPVNIMICEDMVLVIKRHFKKLPPVVEVENEVDKKTRLIQYIKAEIPLVNN